MAEKILNTRIALKIDTLENWNKSTLPLRKGELALATVAATAGTGLSEPVVMMKVGEDGVKTFKDLEWNIYAKASDVVSAAKSEASLRTFIEGVIDSADMASNEDFIELVNKVNVLNGNDSVAGSVAKSIKDAIAALDLANTYDAKGAAAQALVDAKAYTDTAESDAVATAKAYTDELKNGTVATNASDIATLKTNVATNASDITKEADRAKAAEKVNADAIAVLNGSGEGSVAKAVADAVATEKSARESADTTLGNRIKAVEDDYLKAADKTELSNAIAAEASRADIAEKANAAAIKAISDDYLKASDKTELNKAITDEVNRAKGIEGGLETRLAAVEGDYLKATDKKTLQDQITENANAIELLTNGVSAEEVDGVNDLIQYVKDHGTEVTGIKEDIAANTKAIEDLTSAASGAYETKTDAAAKLIEAKQHATDLNSAMNTRVEALEAIDHSHDNKALLDTYTQTETNLADAVAKKHAHTFVESELNKIASGDVAKWNAAEQNAKDYADTEIAKLADGAVKTNTNAIAKLNGDVNTTGSVAKTVADAVKVENERAVAKEAELAKAVTDGDAATLASAKEDAAAKVKALADGQVATNKANIEANATEIAKKANDADLAAIAKTGNINDLIQTAGDVLIFDCGDSVK